MSTSIHKQSDSKLLAAWISRKDQAAFQALVDRFAGMVHASCLRAWNNDSLRAEEAAQAVFIIFAQKAQQIKDPQHIGPWLHRCCINTVRSQQRIEKRHQSKVQAFQEQEQQIEGLSAQEVDQWQDMRTQLDFGINQLSNKLRESLVLHYYQGQSVKEIAQSLDCSETAIKKRLFEARGRLRSFFQRCGYTASLAFLTAALKAESLPHTSIDIHAHCYAASAAFSSNLATCSQSQLIAQGVFKSMFISKLQIASAACIACCSIAFGAMQLQAAEETAPNNTTQQANPSANIQNKNIAQKQEKRINADDGTAIIVQKQVLVDENGNIVGAAAGAHNPQANGANGGNAAGGNASQGNTVGGVSAPPQNKAAHTITIDVKDTTLKNVINRIRVQGRTTIQFANNVDTRQKLTIKLEKANTYRALLKVCSICKLAIKANEDGSWTISNRPDPSGAGGAGGANGDGNIPGR